MMHALAGSAALVVLTLQTVSAVGLGVGSIAGMALLSTVIAVPLRPSSTHLTRVHHALSALVGGFSCVLGAFLVVEIGYLKSLLGA